MELTAADKRHIRQSVRDKYAEVARSPEGRFRYPTGRRGLERQGYPADILSLPEEVLSCFCGVGNPLSLGRVGSGSRVLDVGCGCGLDTLLAALVSAPGGEAIGIDPVPQMVALAEENRRKAGIRNCSFQEASAEALPFAEASFHALLSNGALNLVPEKKEALQEAFRVLKPGGSFLIADEVLVGSLPQSKQERLKSWAG